jgi:hypothetical protein
LFSISLPLVFLIIVGSSQSIHGSCQEHLLIHFPKARISRVFVCCVSEETVVCLQNACCHFINPVLVLAVCTVVVLPMLLGRAFFKSLLCAIAWSSLSLLFCSSPSFCDSPLLGCCHPALFLLNGFMPAIGELVLLSMSILLGGHRKQTQRT